MTPASGSNLWQINGGGVVALVVVTLAAYFLAVAPMLDARETAEAQARELEQRVAQERDLERKLHAVRDQVERAAKEASYVQGTLQPLRHLNRRLADLADAATRAGVQINAIEPGPAPTHHGRYSSYRIRINGRGRFGDCVRFIDAIHENTYHLAVVSFDLSGAGGGSTGAPLAFAMQLDWYAAPTEVKGASR